MFPTPVTESLTEICPPLTGVLTLTKRFFESLLPRFAGMQPAPKIHVTGHSLGGWVAIELAKKFPNEISGGHVFNAGSSVTGRFMDPALRAAVRWWTDDSIHHGNFRHHHISGDSLSSGYEKIGSGKTTHYHGNGSWNPITTHSIKNFSEVYDKNPVSLCTPAYRGW
jgi:hypothetical protein